jgi:hypothetical protein
LNAPAEGVELFVNLVNAFDAHYATYGMLRHPTGIGAPGVPVNRAINGPGIDNRFGSRAPPMSVFAGAGARFQPAFPHWADPCKHAMNSVASPSVGM